MRGVFVLTTVRPEGDDTDTLCTVYVVNTA
jgi:hypothetical protein